MSFESVVLSEYILTLESGSRAKGGAVDCGIPSLGAEHLKDDGTFNLLPEKLKYIPTEHFEKMKSGIIKKEDILIVKDGATTGKVAFVDDQFPFEKAAINEHVFLLRPNEKIIPYYLYSYLKSEAGKVQILKDFRGATVGGISRSFINISIPLPSYDLQQQIAYTLKKFTALISKRREQISLLEKLAKDVFFNMFGDLSQNSKQWDIKNILDIASFDTRMTKDFDKYADLYHIGIENIEKNTGDIINPAKVKYSGLISGKYLFDERHIIYSKIRPNLNKVALPTFSGLCSADSYPILVKDGICERTYLAYALRSDFFLDYILSFSGRTNIPKVNKQQISGFDLPVPPIEQQKQFTKALEKINAHKSRLLASLLELESTYKATMQKAFNDQLFS